MLKRQRSDGDSDSVTNEHNVKRPQSARLQPKNKDLLGSHSYLPSPIPSVEHKDRRGEKRKSTSNDDNDELENTQQKKRKRSSSTRSKTNSICTPKHPDLTSYWVYEQYKLPPQGYIFAKLNMASETSGMKRKIDASSSRSTRVSERFAMLLQNGVHMFQAQRMNGSGEEICDKLLASSSTSPRAPALLPCYKEEHRSEVLQRAATASEAIIQRDILPTVVPSVQNLNLLKLDFYKGIELDHFIDELNTEWTRSTTLGGRNPKPDYVAGLCRRAFDPTIWNTLMRYANTETPILLSPEMCFPLVIGESKRGSAAIQDAVLQATHAAAIAVRSQISLHKAAYGDSHQKTEELYGQPLVFSVCHDHQNVLVHAHFALMQDDKPQYCLRVLRSVSLTLDDGRERNVPNTLVEDIYKIFIPLHLSRLRAAAHELHKKEESAALTDRAKQIGLEMASQGSTGVSFDASQLGLHDDVSAHGGLGESQEAQDSGDIVFKKPSLPESVKVVLENAKLRKLVEHQQAEFKHREEKLESRLEELSKQISQLLSLLGTKTSS